MLPPIKNIQHVDRKRELEEVMLNLLGEVVEDADFGLINKYNSSGSNLADYFTKEYSIFHRGFIEEFAAGNDLFITFIQDGRVPYTPPRDNCGQTEIYFAIYVSFRGLNQKYLQDMRRVADDIKAMITTKSTLPPYGINLEAESFSSTNYQTNFVNNVAGATITTYEGVDDEGDVSTAAFTVKMRFFW